MKRILQVMIFSVRQRRSRALSAALWLIRQIRDAENSDLERYSEQLDNFDRWREKAIGLDYIAIEDKYLSCEETLNSLELAIEELEFAY